MNLLYLQREQFCHLMPNQKQKRYVCNPSSMNPRWPTSIYIWCSSRVHKTVITYLTLFLLHLSWPPEMVMTWKCWNNIVFVCGCPSGIAVPSRSDMCSTDQVLTRSSSTDHTTLHHHVSTVGLFCWFAVCNLTVRCHLILHTGPLT